MISVKNVHKSCDDHVVLDNISTEMLDGQCKMIVGAAGSRRAVWMRSIIGLRSSEAGRI